MAGHSNVRLMDEWRPLRFHLGMGGHWAYLALVVLVVGTQVTCRHWFSPADLSARCRTFWPEHDLQLWSGEVRFGYTYAAGQMHFARVFTFQVPGLLRDAAHDHFVMELPPHQWSIPSFGEYRPVG